MTVLALDTSMAPTAACVVREDGEAFRTPDPSPERLLGPPDHSAELLPVLAGLLADAGRDWPDIRWIAVGTGPGTFTGLRIGVATARALGQALDVPLRPVSSLEALAAGLAGRAGPGRAVVPLIDARRRQVFAALFRPRGGAAPAELMLEWGPAALSRGELLDRLRDLVPAPLAGGDWAVESRADLEAAGVELPPAGSGAHSIDPLELCRLAEGAEPVRPEAVEPTYVRLPDAEINRRNARSPDSPA
jgi:tRNA threonylcarbamoyladenosine biosynthesis protein TsaB